MYVLNNSVLYQESPPGPDLALMHCEKGWSSITASSSYEIWPPSRARAGLNPPLQKREVFGVPGLIEMIIGFTQVAGPMKRHKRRDTQ